MAATRALNNPRESPIPDDFRARWKARFEHRATVFDDDAGIAGWTKSGLEARFRSFRRSWSSDGTAALWLDIGCGAGTYTRFLHQEGLRVIGMDYSIPTLRKARARSPSEMRWVAADVTRLPVRAGTIDGVLCFGVLQAIPASRPALEAIAEALKPAGALWIDFLNARFIPSRLEIRRWRKAGKSPHLRYETAQDLVAALRECGYDVIAVHWIPILPSALQWLQPLAACRPVRWLLRHAPRLAESASHSILVEARRHGDPPRST
jgi:SAM-dependent methyltransferase